MVPPRSVLLSAKVLFPLPAEPLRTASSNAPKPLYVISATSPAAAVLASRPPLTELKILLDISASILFQLVHVVLSSVSTIVFTALITSRVPSSVITFSSAFFSRTLSIAAFSTPIASAPILHRPPLRLDPRKTRVFSSPLFQSLLFSKSVAVIQPSVKPEFAAASSFHQGLVAALFLKPFARRDTELVKLGKPLLDREDGVPKLELSLSMAATTRATFHFQAATLQTDLDDMHADLTAPRSSVTLVTS